VCWFEKHIGDVEPRPILCNERGAESLALTGGCIATDGIEISQEVIKVIKFWLARRWRKKKSTHVAGFEGKTFFNRLADIHAPVDIAIDDVNLGDAVNDDDIGAIIQTHGKVRSK